MSSQAEHTQIDSLYFSPFSSMLLTLKSTPIVAVVSSSDKKSSSVNRSKRDDLPASQSRLRTSIGELTDRRIADKQKLEVGWLSAS